MAESATRGGLNVIITMAGSGTRFTAAGYAGPKFQLEAHGRSMFWWSLRGLSHLFASAHFIFVARAEHRASEFIATECGKLGLGGYTVVELEAETDGQATTAFRALRFCIPERPLAIYNIDTFVAPGAIGAPPEASDGWLPCFEPTGDHWSFVRLAPSGLATEVREKVRISSHATIGFYWFRSVTLFAGAYHASRAHSPRGDGAGSGETYVAPLYNELIATGRPVRISHIDVAAVSVLGTPEELEAFRRAPAPAMAENPRARLAGT